MRRARHLAYEAADAVCRVIWDEREPEEHDALFDILGARLMEIVEADDGLGGATTDELVAQLCDELGLSPEGTAQWENLPEQPQEGSVWFDFDRPADPDNSA